jgi:hypothetical protein
MKWEKFNGNQLVRTRTPYGWLVKGFRSMAYVPDASGEWKVDNDEKEITYY